MDYIPQKTLHIGIIIIHTTLLKAFFRLMKISIMPEIYKELDVPFSLMAGLWSSASM